MVKDSRELKIGAAAKKIKNGWTVINFKTKIGAENNRKIWNNIRQQMDELRIHCGDAKQTFIENQLEKGQLEKFGWRHDKHLLDHEEWLEASIINNFHNQQLKAEY